MVEQSPYPQGEEIKYRITQLYFLLNQKAAKVSGEMEKNVIRYDTISQFKEKMYELFMLASFDEDFAEEARPICKKYFAQSRPCRPDELRNRFVNTLRIWEKISYLLRKHKILLIKSRD